MIRKTSGGDWPDLNWRKSSYSSNSNEPDCVEVAHTSGATHIRDSKVILGPHFTVTGAAWTDFLGAL